MVATAAIGLALGLALGAVLARGRVCFNAGLRRAAFEGDARVLRVFAAAVAVQLLALPALSALGVPLAPLPFLPVAQLAGGLVFGAGMALAGGCIAGSLWKAGAGSLALALALAGFAAGELLALGPGRPAVAGVADLARPSVGTLPGVLGLPYALAALPLGFAALAGLARGGRAGIGLGAGLGLLAAAAWPAAAATGYGYGLGFGGTAAAAQDAIATGRLAALSLPAYVAVGVVAGAALATRGPLRRPNAARAGRALAGGALMGAGAAVAHGCNIGHVLAGVPLLALGSIVATAAMAAGALGTWRVLLAPRPRLRGAERPEPAGW